MKFNVDKIFIVSEGQQIKTLLISRFGDLSNVLQLYNLKLSSLERHLENKKVKKSFLLKTIDVLGVSVLYDIDFIESQLKEIFEKLDNNLSAYSVEDKELFLTLEKLINKLTKQAKLNHFMLYAQILSIAVTEMINPTESIYKLEQIIKTDHCINCEFTKVRAAYEIARIYYKKCEYSKSTKQIKQIAKSKLWTQNTKLTARAKHLLAMNYIALNKHRESLKLMEEVCKLYDKPDEICRMLNTMAYTHNLLGQKRKALKILNDALELDTDDNLRLNTINNICMVMDFKLEGCENYILPLKIALNKATDENRRFIGYANLVIFKIMRGDSINDIIVKLIEINWQNISRNEVDEVILNFTKVLNTSMLNYRNQIDGMFRSVAEKSQNKDEIYRHYGKYIYSMRKDD